MKKRITGLLLASLAILLLMGCDSRTHGKILFVCNEENDLYRAMADTYGGFKRFSSAEKAIEMAPEGSGILLLAEEYPAEKVTLSEDFFKKAESKNIRLYIEFPGMLPGIKTGDIRKTKWERAVITSDVFGESLKKMRIVTINDCHYVDVDHDSPYMVVAKVAGVDKAVYGLEGTVTHPLLFEVPGKKILVSATKLSQFITARYAPEDAWVSIWRFVIDWFQQEGLSAALHWTPSVRPAYSRDVKISRDRWYQAASRGVEWYYKSDLLATPLQVKKGVRYNVPADGEYGREGIRECFTSKINLDGSQNISENRRGDCCSESAMALAMRGMIEKSELDKTTAKNLLDFVYFNSRMRQGPRNDPNSNEYGFIDWYDRDNDHEGVYYADDNARVVMGTLVAAAALNTDRWDEGALACVLANFRATSVTTGFKPRRLDASPASTNTLAVGWKHYRDARDYYHFSPHYQSWIMAMYLWLYDKTEYTPILDIAKTGIKNMMKAYPDKWEWTNGLQQERARMILPLAWLVRIEDTPQNRQWLNTMVEDLLSYQDECGAIREVIGRVGHGKYGPPKSNAEYGTREAPLIQENGDPVSDMLYTSNFAFLSLTEAAAVTGDEKIKDAVDRLAEFLVRIQVRSTTHPELDGAWFRAFEYDRWEYWGSNSDRGWGVWCTETGWTQSWITTMLMMQRLNTSFWDFTAGSKIAVHFAKYRDLMLRDL